MHTIILKNQRFLKACSIGAWTIGIVILVLVLVALIANLMEVWSAFDFGPMRWRPLKVFRLIIYVFPAMMALILAQFIDYSMRDDSREPGWFLRKHDRLLPTYVVFLLIHFVWATLGDIQMVACGSVSMYGAPSHLWPWSETLLYCLTVALPQLLFLLMKLLILLGLCQALRRIVPMICESKTLV